MRRIYVGLLCATFALYPQITLAQIKPGGGLPVTPAGTSATTAGAVQGVTGGVPLNVVVTGGGGGGLSVTDGAGFTGGTSNFTPGGCTYNSPSIPQLAPGTQGTFGCDANRNLLVNGGVIQATTTPQYQTNSATTAQQIAAAAGQKVYITQWSCVTDSAASAAGECQLVQGTGTNCGTGTADLSKAYTYAANDGHTFGVGLGPILISAASQAVCVKTTTTNLVTVGIAATQF